MRQLHTLSLRFFETRPLWGKDLRLLRSLGIVMLLKSIPMMQLLFHLPIFIKPCLQQHHMQLENSQPGQTMKTLSFQLLAMEAIPTSLIA